MSDHVPAPPSSDSGGPAIVGKYAVAPGTGPEILASVPVSIYAILYMHSIPAVTREASRLFYA